MSVNFLYSHPTWLIGLVVISICTGLSLLGLTLFNRLVDVHVRHRDTETIGLTFAIIAVIYAVLIAFIVVDVFEAAARADEIATAEANQLSALMLDSAGLEPRMGDAVRADLNRYIDIVVKSEWPAQHDGRLGDAVFEPGWTVIGQLSRQLAEFEPPTSGQNVNKAEMLHSVNDLMKARRSRIIAAGDHLPTVVWQILILAGVLSVGYTFLFGAKSCRIHLAVTGLISATIGLVFVLIIALDYPFRGEVSVGDDAFLSVQSTASSVAEPTAPQPGPAH